MPASDDTIQNLLSFDTSQSHLAQNLNWSEHEEFDRRSAVGLGSESAYRKVGARAD